MCFLDVLTGDSDRLLLTIENNPLALFRGSVPGRAGEFSAVWLNGTSFLCGGSDFEGEIG